MRTSASQTYRNPLSHALAVKARSGVTRLMARTLSASLPLYIVNEYPRSGGSWISQMLAAVLGVPCPRNAMPRFESCVIHGHFRSPRHLSNVVAVWRDGRDVLTSYYYYHYFYLPRSKEFSSKIVKRLPFRDVDDVRSNLPKFIDLLCTSPVQPRFSWGEYVDTWQHQPGVVHTRYEDFVRFPERELRRVVAELVGVQPSDRQVKDVVSRFSFRSQTGRAPGNEDRTQFARKGMPGDWRRCFTVETARLFERHAGQQLIKLGYEVDSTWVEQLNDGRSQIAVASNPMT